MKFVHLLALAPFFSLFFLSSFSSFFVVFRRSFTDVIHRHIFPDMLLPPRKSSSLVKVVLVYVLEKQPQKIVTDAVANRLPSVTDSSRLSKAACESVNIFWLRGEVCVNLLQC